MNPSTEDIKVIDELRAHYDGKQTGNKFAHMDYMIDGQPVSEEWYDKALRQPLIEKLELKPDSRVLDIGCGAGLVISEIETKCAKVIGVDISKSLIALYQGKSELFVCAAHELSFAHGSFDRIYMLSVAVHFPNFDYLKGVINNCLGMLADDGVLVISDLIITTESINSRYLVVDTHELVEYLEACSYPYTISAQSRFKRSFSRRKDIVIYKDSVVK